MTRQREVERLLDVWLGEGSSVAPDRVIDNVADRIERQPQWPAWLFSERTRRMNPTLRIAAAVVAIAILGAGAVYLTRPSTPDVGGPSPAASPSGVPSAAPSPSQERTSSQNFEPAVSVDLPTGWYVGSDDERTFSLLTTAAGGLPAGSIEIRRQPALGNNAGECDGAADPEAGTSPAEILQALSRVERFAITQAGPVSVAGRTLDAVDVRLQPTWTGTCSWSGGLPAGVLFTVFDPPGGFSGLRGAEVIRAVILDVNGVTVAVSLSPTDSADFDAFMSAAMPILESIAFAH